MTSVDDLFKVRDDDKPPGGHGLTILQKPYLPGANKRKSEAVKNPGQGVTTKKCVVLKEFR